MCRKREITCALKRVLAYRAFIFDVRRCLSIALERSKGRDEAPESSTQQSCSDLRRGLVVNHAWVSSKFNSLLFIHTWCIVYQQTSKIGRLWYSCEWNSKLKNLVILRKFGLGLGFSGLRLFLCLQNGWVLFVRRFREIKDCTRPCSAFPIGGQSGVWSDLNCGLHWTWIYRLRVG